jgi:hypothetical protein
MKNQPQDGSNRRDRQQDPRETERRDFTPNPESKSGERRQQDPGVKERKEMTPNPGDRQGGQRQQDPRRTERQDMGSNPGGRPNERQGGEQGGQRQQGGDTERRDFTQNPRRPGEQGTDRPNTQQKFPGAKDRPETERVSGDRDTQSKPRRNDEAPDTIEPNQEPYMGRKHEE